MSIVGKLESGELKQGEPDAIERLIQKWRHEAAEWDDTVHSPMLERCATELEREYIGDDPGQEAITRVKRVRPAKATMEPHEDAKKAKE